MLKLYFNKRDGLLDVPTENYISDDVAVFGFNGLNKINYKAELSGKENALSKFASLSKSSGKIIISGAITDNYGIIRKSCVVAENGKILGISDMNLCFDDSSLSSGGGHRVYQTKVGRIGVLVGDDIIDMEAVKAMALCDADLIIGIVSSEEKPQFSTLCRAYSFLFGVPVAMFSASGTLIGDIFGEIAGGSQNEESHLIVLSKKFYRPYRAKRRGAKP